LFDDPANHDERHDRSWIRQRVLPLLGQRFGPSLGSNILRGTRHAARDRRAWSELLRAVPGLGFESNATGATVAPAPVQAYDKALSEALLRAVAREAGYPIGPARARRLREWISRAKSGGVFQLGSGWLAEVAFDRIIVRRQRGDGSAQTTWGGKGAGSV